MAGAFLVRTGIIGGRRPSARRIASAALLLHHGRERATTVAVAALLVIHGSEGTGIATQAAALHAKEIEPLLRLQDVVATSMESKATPTAAILAIELEGTKDVMLAKHGTVRLMGSSTVTAPPKGGDNPVGRNADAVAAAAPWTGTGIATQAAAPWT